MHAPLVNNARELGPSRHDWWCDWRGQICAIIASGPSAKTADIDLLRERVRVITINESWQLAPWAEVLYGCDGRWWKLRDYVPEFRGLKLTFDADASQHPTLAKINVDTSSDKILVDEPGRIGSGGNSGFQALNLAVQFGAATILLIGFDMQLDLGIHWHGRHPPPLSNPCADSTLPRWRRAFDLAHDRLVLLGVQVINCSPVSALTAYPKMTIAQALM